MAATTETRQTSNRRRTRARWTLVGLIAALALGAVVYRLLAYGGLQQTAALFIGLPAILAAGLALAAEPRGVTGYILTGMTIALLMSGVVLGEGLICILMASPLFYLVGWLVGASIEAIRRLRGRGRGERLGPGMLCLAMVPFAALSAEGVRPELSFPRQETVVAERVVAGSAAEVERALAGTPRFDRELPLFLQLGFPRPVGARGAGLEPGDARTISFVARGTSDLAMGVVEREPGRVRFRAVSDETPVARWLRWQEAEVRWREVEPGYTQVRWTLRYERRLDPAWYFGPWERYGARLAAAYLVDTVAAPREP
jgi:hypothetical protein